MLPNCKSSHLRKSIARAGKAFALSILLLVAGCSPVLINYSSEVSNPVRVKANILVRLDDSGLAPDFVDPETKQSIIDAVKNDLKRTLFYTGANEVDVRVKIEKLDYSNALWGILWMPLWVVGAPVGRVSAETVVQLDIRSSKGKLLKSYRAGYSDSKWYNSVFYNKNSTTVFDGGIARFVLKNAMEDIKYRIIEDRYSIVQLLESPQEDGNPAVGLQPVVPSSDVDFNIPKTPMHDPDAVAVVIGIGDYLDADIPRVENARQDAAMMRQYLINVLGYDEKNILPRNPDQLITASVLKTIIRQQLPGFVRPGISDVFVYYSGHGAPNTTTQKAFFVLADCNPNFVNDDNGYQVDSFYDDLSKIPCRNLTVVIDACFSGMSGGGMIVKNASPLFVNVEHPLLGKDNATIFTASKADQVSNWYPEKKHGLFTYFFLKGLQGAADLDGDGVVTVGEMERYLLDENSTVPYLSRREFQRVQTPQVIGKEKDRVLVKYQME
jgi:hypothetical protein